MDKRLHPSPLTEQLLFVTTWKQKESLPVAFRESAHQKASQFQPELESLLCTWSLPHKVIALPRVSGSSPPRLLLLSSFHYWQIQHRSSAWHLNAAFLSTEQLNSFIYFVIIWEIVTQDKKRNQWQHEQCGFGSAWTKEREEQSLSPCLEQLPKGMQNICMGHLSRDLWNTAYFLVNNQIPVL